MLKVLEENWLHVRHAETERLTILTVFGTVSVGVMAYAWGKDGSDGARLLAMWVVLVLCVFGAAFSLRFAAVFGKIAERIAAAARRLEVADLMWLTQAEDHDKRYGINSLFVAFYLVGGLLSGSWLFLRALSGE